MSKAANARRMSSADVAFLVSSSCCVAPARLNASFGDADVVGEASGIWDWRGIGGVTWVGEAAVGEVDDAGEAGGMGDADGVREAVGGGDVAGVGADEELSGSGSIGGFIQSEASVRKSRPGLGRTLFHQLMSVVIDKARLYIREPDSPK